MTEKEMLNEIDHLRRALNSEKLKNSELARKLKIERQLRKMECSNTRFWHETATLLRSNILNLISKYETEALKGDYAMSAIQKEAMRDDQP